MARRTLRLPPEEQPFEVRKSKIAGLGAFATRDIRKGERIVEYLGERVSHKVADARYDDHADSAHHTFLFSVNRSVVIDAYVDGNDARYINHSCDGNCESEIEAGRVFIDAVRNIRKGEELTYDYAYGRDGSETPEEEVTLYGCRCGSRKCRGTILEAISRKRRLELYGKKHTHPKHAAARQAHKHGVSDSRGTTGRGAKGRGAKGRGASGRRSRTGSATQRQGKSVRRGAAAARGRTRRGGARPR
ncbi:MAG: SET domain-containing protein-lysine N-methyltransferase [Gemmatimonadota bacterium]|nr:SET domain-containing protein-lysine N-methyltransferase [Gemmatimonadota bacterium]